MDYIEIAGAVVGLIAVAFEYKASIWLWIFGLIMPILYTIVCFQNGIYANMCINIYYVIAYIYGLLVWTNVIRSKNNPEQHISSMPKKYIIPAIIFTIVISSIISYILYLMHESDIYLLDGFSTGISITGMWMMTRKYYQKWLCWIMVDPILTVMFATKLLIPSTILYATYSIVSVMGYFKWKKESIN